MSEEIIKILLDDMPIARFIAFYIIALVGMFIFFAIQVNKAVKTNPNTPSKFSWKRLFSVTTVIRLVASILALAFAVVYYEELLVMIFNVEIAGPINAVGALILGVSIDKIVDGIIGAGETLTRRK